jgi:hypothetical protein
MTEIQACDCKGGCNYELFMVMDSWPSQCQGSTNSSENSVTQQPPNFTEHIKGLPKLPMSKSSRKHKCQMVRVGQKTEKDSEQQQPETTLPESLKVEVPASDVSLVFLFAPHAKSKIEVHKYENDNVWKLCLSTLQELFASDVLEDWFDQFFHHKFIGYERDEKAKEHYIVVTATDKSSASIVHRIPFAPKNALQWHAFEDGLQVNIETMAVASPVAQNLDPNQWIPLFAFDRNEKLRNACKKQFYSFIEDLIKNFSNELN